MKLQLFIFCFLYSSRFFKPAIKKIKNTIELIDFLQKNDHPFFLTVF